jgi:CDP-diacylglycerol--serine O-phosphatidyltransferase
MVFDGLDGYVARLSKTSSDFGGQLDSLCDAISFGVAPAFLLLLLGREWGEHPVIQKAIAVVAVLYMTCAILRLARFNVENSPDPAAHKRFKGLPSPAAAGCIASLCLLRGGLGAEMSFLDADRVRALVTAWAPLGGLVAALLMVSRVPYPHATKQLLRGRRRLSHLVQLLLLLAVVAITHELALCLLFWGYTLAMPVRYALVRALRPAKPGLDDAVPSPRIR